MECRKQRTIRKPAEVKGIGYLTGVDVTVRFLPATANEGIQFQRTDLPDSRPIPALLDFAVPRERRTTLERDGICVEMTEHVLAALSGLKIDNCTVELNASETPGCDGSALWFAEALMEAEPIELDVTAECYKIDSEIVLSSDDGKSEIVSRPLMMDSLVIGYQLDYGSQSPIPAQMLNVEIDEEAFMKEIAPCRTFVLETEVKALRALGYGQRISNKEILIFGENGLIDNELRFEDECARHKILDCLGDLALLGGELNGFVSGYRSGHRLNRDLARRLKLLSHHSHSIQNPGSQAA